MKNVKTVSDVAGKFIRDCAVASIALVTAKASEVTAKAAWNKGKKLYEDYSKNGIRPLRDYAGLLSDEEINK